jgi:tRNA-dihydrouridine synthase
MKLIRTVKEEMPVGIQIFGQNEEVLSKSVLKLNQLIKDKKLYAFCIDLNFGCPAYSVVRAGAGASLLKDKEKIKRIVKSCVDVSDIPVSAKIRLGWNKNEAFELAKIIEKAGASFITIHCRTAVQKKENPDWQTIKKIKEEVSIPIVGNGGAISPQAAVLFLQTSDADAIMISSGALGNPKIFSDSCAFLEKGQVPFHSPKEKIEDFLLYIDLANKYSILEINRLKLHAQEFFKGFEGAKQIRQKINLSKDISKIIQITNQAIQDYSLSSEEKI